MDMLTDIDGIEYKRALRREARTRLRNIAAEERRISSQKILIQLIANAIFRKSKTVACYIPIDNEVETSGIIAAIWHYGKRCYLPAIISNQQMVFASFQPNDQLISKKYNILEPMMVNDRTIDTMDLDLVIVPLLGFNANFFRLGRGVGYYDRAFAFRRFGGQKPYLLGIGYQAQLLNFAPSDWDIPMDNIMVA